MKRPRQLSQAKCLIPRIQAELLATLQGTGVQMDPVWLKIQKVADPNGRVVDGQRTNAVHAAVTNEAVQLVERIRTRNCATLALN